MKKLPASAVLWAFIGLAWGSLAEAASLNNNAYLYQGPGYNYAQLLTMPKGANVAIGECRSQWCQANYGGQGGFIHQSFIVGGAYGAKAACRGGPSLCKGYGPSLYTFSLGSAARAGNTNGRGGGGGNNGTFPGFNNPILE